MLWFAQLREGRAAERESVAFTPGTTLAQLYATLCPPARLPVAFAQNGERVSGETPLVEGAEVVFLPPVGGG